MGETDREHATVDLAEAIEAILGLAVRDVPCNHASRVSESVLRAEEGNGVLALVFRVLVGI